MSKVKINIARDFSKTPGARYRQDGPKSGEEFREDMLEKYFENENDDTIVEIELDGTIGYVSSFLEETFGGLVRKYSRERVKNKIILIADKMNFYKEKANEYIEKAKYSKE